MRRNYLIYMGLAIFSLAVSFYPSCDKSVEFANSPPSGLHISKNLCNLATGDEIELTASASDADGDSVTFSWSSDAGTFGTPGPGGKTITWTAPSTPGVYSVVVTATDNIDSRKKSIDIAVGPVVQMHPGEVLLDQTDYPYFIENINPIFLPEGASIRITAGVTVIVNEPTSGLRIEGSLTVEGTESARVVFKPNLCPGDEGAWGGITLSGSEAHADLEYLTVFSATTGITVKDMASDVVMRGVTVESSSGAGVWIYGGATARMEECKVWDNGTGILVDNGHLDIKRSSIRYNSTYGMYLVSGTAGGGHEALVDSCIVASNLGDGFVLSQQATAVINYNSIFLNETENGIGYGLKLVAYTGAENIDARYNYWGTDSEAGVQAQIFEGPVVIDVLYSGWLSEPPVSE